MISDDVMSNKSSIFNYITLITDNLHSHIYQAEDEWFYVRISKWLDNNKEFFKCDQLEGVVKLLKDRNIL